MIDNLHKQILLSIVGICILVFMVIGVSFAFFTYTRTGGQNNQITTGSLIFSFEDGDNAINLVNYFPVSTNVGLNLNGENKICTFSISGKSSGTPINFDIFAVKGLISDNRNRFPDEHVSINIDSVTTSNGITFVSANSSSSLNSPQKYLISNLDGDALNTDLAAKNLGHGVINSIENVSMSFTVRVWIDDGIVSIGNESNNQYTADAYSNMYYSIKVMVVANA